MEWKKIERGGAVCALLCDNTVKVTDAQSAMDVLLSAKYEMGTGNIALSKQQLAEDFFVLSTGLAGEILQKYVNYGGRIAIYGDFSRYTSKPLRDFIYESNQGDQVFFVADEEAAVEKLLRVSPA